MKLNYKSLLIIAGIFAISACGTTNSNGKANQVNDMNTAKAELNIVETASSAGQFNTLLAAAKAAGLVDTLTSKGPFTVFAPTDDAFASLPTGTVEELLLPENRDKLAAILSYHVVPGKINSTKVVSLSSAETVQGASLSIRTEGSGVKIDKANVIKADIDCSNGIIHVIDSVLLPPS